MQEIRFGADSPKLGRYEEGKVAIERSLALLAPLGEINANRVLACGRALPVQETKGTIGQDQTYTDDALSCLGQAEVALGRVDDGLAHLSRSGRRRSAYLTRWPEALGHHRQILP